MNLNRVALALALALAGCAHTELLEPREEAAPIVCRTVCGLKGPGPCAELQEVEDRFRAAVNRFVDDWTWETACEPLFGWSIFVHDHVPTDTAECSKKGWPALPKFCVIGYTHEETHTVELADTDYPRNALAHELIHVLDITRWQHAGHCAWKERGVKRALREITGEDDPSAPESYCPKP